MQMTPEEMFEALTENGLARDVGLKYDRAREAYTLPSMVVDDIHVFDDILADFYNQYLALSTGIDKNKYSEMAGYRVATSQEYAGTLVFGIIAKIFPASPRMPSRGLAFNIARSGIDGGLKKVIDMIHQFAKNEAIENRISHVLRSGFFHLNDAEKRELARKYIDRFGKFFPHGEPLYEAEVAFFPERIVPLHMAMISKMRGTFG